MELEHCLKRKARDHGYGNDPAVLLPTSPTEIETSRNGSINLSRPYLFLSVNTEILIQIFRRIF